MTTGWNQGSRTQPPPRPRRHTMSRPTQDHRSRGPAPLSFAMTDADQVFQHSHGTALVTPAVSVFGHQYDVICVAKARAKATTHLHASHLDCQVAGVTKTQPTARQNRAGAKTQPRRTPEDARKPPDTATPSRTRDAAPARRSSIRLRIIRGTQTHHGEPPTGPDGPPSRMQPLSPRMPRGVDG